MLHHRNLPFSELSYNVHTMQCALSLFLFLGILRYTPWFEVRPEASCLDKTTSSVSVFLCSSCSPEIEQLAQANDYVVATQTSPATKVQRHC